MSNKAQSYLRANIIVGQPLPFSVFGANQKLLLAKGRIVESHNVRERLLSYAIAPDEAEETELSSAAISQPPVCPLLAMRESYSDINGRSRLVLQMSLEEGGEAFLASIVGVHEQHSLIVTAPARADRSLLPVTDGQMWWFRAMHATTALRFQTIVKKSSFEPFPHLHLALPQRIDHRTIRAAPRTTVCLDASIERSDKTYSCVVVDLSVGGARLGLRKEHELSKGDKCFLEFRLSLLGREFTVRVCGSVTGAYGTTDARHGDIAFYGVSFDSLDDDCQLKLHGYVHERMASALDYLTKVLSYDSLGHAH